MYLKFEEKIIPKAEFSAIETKKFLLPHQTVSYRHNMVFSQCISLAVKITNTCHSHRKKICRLILTQCIKLSPSSVSYRIHRKIPFEIRQFQRNSTNIQLDANKHSLSTKRTFRVKMWPR